MGNVRVLIAVFFMASVGFAIHYWEKILSVDNIMTLVAFVLTIGNTLLMQLAKESSTNRRIEQKNLALLKRELYDNFLVCLLRIEKRSEEVAFFSEAYDNLVGTDQVIKVFEKDEKVKNFKLSELYFLIKRGSFAVKTFSQFYDDCFTNHKKSATNFDEMKHIINGVGTDSVMEFLIIKYLIWLNETHQLKLNLPYHNFLKVLQYHGTANRPFDDLVTDYITEEVCKVYFKQGESKIFYRDSQSRRIANCISGLND
ncbi:MAG TPA: hypothetical protein VHS59_00105 [Bacillota bacterium]|nr:hypothetical protein [Bacillota bacterium]